MYSTVVTLYTGVDPDVVYSLISHESVSVSAGVGLSPNQQRRWIMF